MLAGVDVGFLEYLQVARLAEAAKFDAVFVADDVATNFGSGSLEAASRNARVFFL